MTTNLAQAEPTRQAEACNSRLECLRDRKGIYGIGMVGGIFGCSVGVRLHG